MSRSISPGVLLDHAQDMVVLLDKEGTVTYANDAVRRVAGYDPDEFVGTDVFEFVHPDDRDGVRETFEATIAAGSFTERTAEYRFRTSDGSWVHLESRLSNLMDEALDGYVVSSRDVTDRVAARRDQQETATRLEELAAVSSDVLWMFDGDWSEVLFVNPAYETVYGQSVERLEADPGSFMDAIHPDDVPRVEDAMARLAGGTAVDMEYRVNPGRDYAVWVWVQAEPIVEDGEVVRITGFTRDVTDRDRRRRQLYVMDKLLRHNLRNDLTTILGNADLIEDRAPETADRCAVIRRTGERLLESAEKQRDIIELLTGDVTVERLDVGDVVTDAVAVVEERFPAARIEVDCPDSLRVRALSELGLAVAELVENAVRHSESDAPTVRVTARRDDQRAVVSVRDDAVAIPDNETQVLTGEFELCDLYHSTGLGLWLVHWVVELSEGCVDVSTRNGRGNAVSLSLPRSRT